MLEPIRAALSNPYVLAAWSSISVLSLVVLGRDLSTQNRQIKGLMKVVWVLTVAYSGVFGLAVYFYSGRRQIPSDDLWRRGFRSTSHCYSGCGAGEVIGVILSVGLFAAGQLVAALVTFALAYTFGVALTVGPLMAEGVRPRTALRDGVISESASIVVMEAVAIGVDLVLARDARLGDVLFWTSLLVSLSIGFFAAYPVNVLLVRFGVKEGMGDPTQHTAHADARTA